MNEEKEERKEEEEERKEEEEEEERKEKIEEEEKEEDVIKKAKEERKKNRASKKYSELINYPNMKVQIRQVTERDTDARLFNNIFDEDQVIYDNNVKRYVYCSTIFIIYAAIGFMYYTYIY
jgi:hypothetical protein